MKNLKKGIRFKDGKIPLNPYEYSKMKDKDGNYWILYTPNGYLCGIKKHKVTEHKDGTITVSPSILLRILKDPKNKKKKEYITLWHGFIIKGIWYEC